MSITMNHHNPTEALTLYRREAIAVIGKAYGEALKDILDESGRPGADADRLQDTVKVINEHQQTLVALAGKINNAPDIVMLILKACNYYADDWGNPRTAHELLYADDAVRFNLIYELADLAKYGSQTYGWMADIVSKYNKR